MDFDQLLHGVWDTDGGGAGPRWSESMLLHAEQTLNVKLPHDYVITDPVSATGYPTRFLVWNLFLAWIPLVFALLLTAVRSRAATLIVGAGWLAFLPNAPYLVTDLIHLSGYDELWRHVLQFGFAAWTGTLLGVVSLRIVHLEVARHFGTIAGWSLVAVSCCRGVDLRVGSRPIANVRSTGVVIAVAAFFGLAYITTWALDGLQQRDRHSTRPAHRDRTPRRRPLRTP